MGQNTQIPDCVDRVRRYLFDTGYELVSRRVGTIGSSFTELYANDVVVVKIQKDHGGYLKFSLISRSDRLAHRTVDWKSQLDGLPFAEEGLPCEESAQFLLSRLEEISEILRSQDADNILNAILERSIEWSRKRYLSPLRREDFIGSFWSQVASDLNEND